jgi:hypothetical protein
MDYKDINEGMGESFSKSALERMSRRENGDNVVTPLSPDCVGRCGYFGGVLYTLPA